MARSDPRLGVPLVLGLLALLATGCGGKKKMEEDPVATAMMTPGLRTVVIPKQRNDITIIVTPCSAAAVEQTGANRRPPGSNEIVVPRGTLTQTVAVPPCPMMPKQAVANTVIVTPGGSGAGSDPASPPQNELQVPRNSGIRTIIVPPCTPPPEMGGGGGSKGGGSKSLALKPGGRQKSVTAPPCQAMPMSGGGKKK